MTAPNMFTSFSMWYTDNAHSNTISQHSDLAKEAFDKAVLTFTQKLTKDQSKKVWLDSLQATNIHDVQLVVQAAQKKYEDAGAQSKARKRLTSFAQKIAYYGNVLDVLVQHHPEYVSLAWGAMKFLFMGIIEQENLLSTIAKGLSRIADCLPRAELSAQLYPIPRMKEAISSLYANIIYFQIRAFRWLNEGKLRHAYHAITRPAALRYDDLIEAILEASARVTTLSVMSSHAEQRDMHIELRDLKAQVSDVVSQVRGATDVLSQLHQISLTESTLNANSRADILGSLCELKISQVFATLSTCSPLDPQKSLTASLYLRDRRRKLPRSQTTTLPTNLDLHRWNEKKSSSMVLLQGPIKTRFEIKDFCADVIQHLQATDITVLWMLPSLADTARDTQISLIDVLKNLILQALRFRCAKLPTGFDPVVSQQLPKYLNARTVDDWLAILATVLKDFNTVYIIVDTRTMSSIEIESPSNEQSSVISRFLSLLDTLTRTNSRSNVKVMIAHYGPGLPSLNGSDQSSATGTKQHFVVNVGRAAARSRKGDGRMSQTDPSTTLLSSRNLPNTDKSRVRIPRSKKKKNHYH